MNSRRVEIWELAIRESVRQILADCTAGTDRNRLEDIAACFAPDGVLSFGPAEIVAGLSEAIADGFCAESLMR